jgi:hypothetical protein
MLKNNRSLNSRGFSKSILSLLIEICLVWVLFFAMVLVSKGAPSRIYILAACCLGMATVFLYEFNVINSCINRLKINYREKKGEFNRIVSVLNIILILSLLLGFPAISRFITLGISYINHKPSVPTEKGHDLNF